VHWLVNSPAEFAAKQRSGSAGLNGASGARRSVMKRWPFKLFGVASSLGLFVGIVAAFVALAGSTARADEQVVRWDIIRVIFSPFSINPNGTASAQATHEIAPDVGTSTITMTGSGTFEVPKKNKEGDDVTGGGTWTITTGGVTTSGTYEVTGVVSWLEGPGTFSFTDNVGNAADARTGLAELRIKYSDGDRGILVVSCSGTQTMFEGITASKGLTDFWKTQKNNFTFFHLIQKED
jgi:hypothetical protein